jgi:hypothetical protein
MWIVIAAVVVGLVILVAVSLPVVGRLSGLQRALLRLQRRQTDAIKLQSRAETLIHGLLDLEQRAYALEERIALMKGGQGSSVGKHAFPRRR